MGGSSVAMPVRSRVGVKALLALSGLMLVIVFGVAFTIYRLTIA